MIKVYNAVNACFEYTNGEDIEFVTVAGYAAKGLRVYGRDRALLGIWMPHTYSRIDLFPEKKTQPKNPLLQAYLDTYGPPLSKPTKTPIATIEVW